MARPVWYLIQYLFKVSSKIIIASSIMILLDTFHNVAVQLCGAYGVDVRMLVRVHTGQAISFIMRDMLITKS